MSGYRDVADEHSNSAATTATYDEETAAGVIEEEQAAAARLRASLVCVLAALPPSPGSLPGCSPSFFGSSTPSRLPEASGMDGDKILLENEIENRHSRRPSRTEGIVRIQEPSPSKSQFSDLVRSIGSPNPSLASSEPSTPRRDSFSAESEDNIVAVPWNGGMEICERIPTAGREILYEPEKNGGVNKAEDYTGDPDDPRVPKNVSKAKVFPSSTGLAARDAFGPKLTPALLEPTPSLPETPTPGDPNDAESTGKHANMQNGAAGGAGDGELDPETLFFRDGRRRIDMVLVYQEENEGVMTETEARRRQQRKIFQENLLKEGLQLELEPKDNSFDGKTIFLKLHIPWKVKVRYAEVMNLRLCTKRFITISVKAWGDEGGKGKKKFWEKWLSWFNWVKRIQAWDSEKYPEEPSFYSSTDTGDREERFVVKDRETAYTPAQRSLIVMQILTRTRYDEVSEKAGIRRLLADGTYLDCFPLHEGPYDRPGSDGILYDRHLLYLIWARPSQWFKRQPLWLIRRYFGEKVALYFAWLGFYTKLLYPPAVVGLLCFIYGLASMESPDNIPSREICDSKVAGNITLCPLCDKACTYRKLGESCLFSKLTYLFDNPATVFFAIFMSFWATTFLELWKRRQAVIVWEWDLQNPDGDEEPRPEFETSVKTFRINPVTREREPYLPAWSRAFKFMVTGSMVFFMVNLRRPRRGARDDNISNIAGCRVLRWRRKFSQETREDLHVGNGRASQLDDHHDSHAYLSQTREMDDQLRESANSDGVRGQLHVQDISIRVRQLLLVPHIHRLLQGKILRSSRRHRRAIVRVLSHQDGRLRPGRMSLGALHPAGDNNDRQAVFQQFRGNSVAEIVELVAKADTRGGHDGFNEAVHVLGAGLSASGPRKARALRRVSRNDSSIRLRHTFRRCVSAGSPLRAAEQHRRNPSGRLQNGEGSAKTAGRESRGHRSLVRNSERRDLRGCCVQRFRYRVHVGLHTAKRLCFRLLAHERSDGIHRQFSVGIQHLGLSRGYGERRGLASTSDLPVSRLQKRTGSQERSLRPQPPVLARFRRSVGIRRSLRARGFRPNRNNELRDTGSPEIRVDAASTRAAVGPGGQVREGHKGPRGRGGVDFGAAGGRSSWPGGRRPARQLGPKIQQVERRSRRSRRRRRPPQSAERRVHGLGSHVIPLERDRIAREFFLAMSGMYIDQT